MQSVFWGTIFERDSKTQWIRFQCLVVDRHLPSCGAVLRLRSFDQGESGSNPLSMIALENVHQIVMM
ncbi:unnamed protein product [Periconia digitata]|uniref:Uncharacterized protein n=1 Tax=Periconia digitata TaxID=1303443 RepID=A0A9W4UBM2_9PLEO|nr:unnamed protein product [Periconia digitata]